MTGADIRRTRLVAEGVVSSYIHDISTRSRSAATARPPARRASGPARGHTRGSLRRSRDLIHARREHQAV
jgi:hypothetical protein